MRRILSESIAGIATLWPAPNCVDSLPNNIFAYMTAELAVIASDFPSWKEIVTQERVGICVDPESVDAVADAIRYVI